MRKETLSKIDIEVKKNKRHVATYGKTKISFGRGNFDDWCIYVEGGGYPKFPTDEWYFGILSDWADTLEDKVYNDFVRLYEATGAQVDKEVLHLIERLSLGYPDENEARVIFTILYMGMIAEENKEGAILKKRMKMLGVHQLLIDNFTPKEAANFSRGKSSEKLVMECYNRGFW